MIIEAYGGSTGTPNIEGIFRDVDTSLSFLSDAGIDSNKIIICGVSMGTGFAVYAARNKDIKAVLLLAAYSSLEDVALSYFFMYPEKLIRNFYTENIDTINWIRDIKSPLVMLHGEKDWVIPYKLGKKLFAAAHEPKLMISLPDTGHGFVLSEEHIQKVKAFIDQYPNK